jgi:riboflavin kinase/FMN adenylyltransferase
MSKVITIGNFDGLHLGHQKLLRTLTEEAGKLLQPSLVITYNNHPAEILFHPSQPMLLSTTEAKLKGIRELGVDEVDLISFDESFSRTSAEDFLLNYLIPKHSPSLIVVGFDSHFGHQRQGNYEFLKAHSQSCGYELIYVEPELYEGVPISSSLIRAKLRAGELEIASRLLGRPYSIEGVVVHSKGLGTKLGFPTANLLPLSSHILIPASGIYLSEVSLEDTRAFGLTNIGTSPTVKQDGKTEIETYILDFNEDIYEQNMTVSLLRRIRDEKKFSGLDELTTAMQQDLATARSIIGSQQCMQ